MSQSYQSYLYDVPAHLSSTGLRPFSDDDVRYHMFVRLKDLFGSHGGIKNSIKNRTVFLAPKQNRYFSPRNAKVLFEMLGSDPEVKTSYVSSSGKELIIIATAGQEINMLLPSGIGKFVNDIPNASDIPNNPLPALPVDEILAARSPLPKVPPKRGHRESISSVYSYETVEE